MQVLYFLEAVGQGRKVVSLQLKPKDQGVEHRLLGDASGLSVLLQDGSGRRLRGIAGARRVIRHDGAGCRLLADVVGGMSLFLKICNYTSSLRQDRENLLFNLFMTLPTW